MNTQNLLQKNDTLLTLKQSVAVRTKINFLRSWIESSPCDYSDAYVLFTGNIDVAGVDDNTKVVLKNSAQFRKCTTEINEIRIDEAGHINIEMPIYNLIEYGDSFSDTFVSLWQKEKKRDEIEDVDLTVDDNHISNSSSSIKYK